jgi:hypothetical protein
MNGVPIDEIPEKRARYVDILFFHPIVDDHSYCHFLTLRTTPVLLARVATHVPFLMMRMHGLT